MPYKADVEDLIKKDFLLMLNERVGALETQVHRMTQAIEQLNESCRQLQDDVISVTFRHQDYGAEGWQDDALKEALEMIANALRSAVVNHGGVRIVEAIVAPFDVRVCDVLLRLDRPYFGKVLDRLLRIICETLPTDWRVGLAYTPTTEALWRSQNARFTLHHLTL